MFFFFFWDERRATEKRTKEISKSFFFFFDKTQNLNWVKEKKKGKKVLPIKGFSYLFF